MQLVVVRDGSAVLDGDCTQRPIAVGDALLVAPEVRLGFQPEGEITIGGP